MSSLGWRLRGDYHRRVTDEQADTNPITVLDLFAGCGGLTEGFHQFHPDGSDKPAFRSVGAVEWDKAAAASYAMNFGAESRRKRYFDDSPEIYADDITKWTPRWRKGEIDVVVGGPPCQGFSGLNRNKVGAERNHLWQHFIRVVVETQPKVFVIENVDRFVRSPEFADLKDRIGNGNLTNYRLLPAPGTKDDDTEQERAHRYLLNAADYGALQARRRTIVIGVRTNVDLRPDRMSYPAETHSRDPLIHQDALEGLAVPSDRRKPWLTVDALFKRTAKMTLFGADLRDGKRHTVREIGWTGPGPFRTSELHFTRNPEPLSLARYAAIPPRGNRKDLRGRYLCRPADGAPIILEKRGTYRGDDGVLALSGRYIEVADGDSKRRVFTVEYNSEPDDVPSSSGRSKSRAFRVTLREDDHDIPATLEYLSTDSWDAHNAGSGDVMGRLRLGEPSVTIRTEFFKPEKGRYLHPTEDRPITHFEGAKLQGFPDHFLWCGSKTDIARQIGNAVPIPLGKAIAGAIYEYLRPAG